jgi:hypothetical protein
MGIALRPEDVADEIGMSPTQIRNFMRLGRFKPAIGYAYKGTGRQYCYRIYRPMLDEYLHKKAPSGVTDEAVQGLIDLVRASQAENEALRATLMSLIGREKKEA